MTIELIPLNKLIPCPANVRKTDALSGIAELAASIKAHGLLQNLQVRPGAKGKYEVVAGGRRLAALRRLAKQKAIAKTEDIACQVMETDDAAEISLAENVVRVQMHPADEYEAFKALADQGKGPQEIAARFGCSPMTVKRRLKLGNVSPKLMEAYREGKLDLDQLMAFTVSDDHAAQEQVWASLPHWNFDPDTIRRHLMVSNVEASDRRVRFVGLKAYKKAGGHIIRDLFQPEHEGYLTDPDILNRLVTEKLERAAEAIRAEGWKWVVIMPTINHEKLRGLRRVYPEREPLSEQQQADVDALTARYDALIEEHGEDAPDETAAELEEISGKIDALSEGTERWLPEDIAIAGAVVNIGYNGERAVERGLVKPEDKPVKTGYGNPSAKHSVRQGNGVPGLSDRLVEDLTAHRTAALRTVLAGNVEIALAAVVHALALPIFFPHEMESCLAVKLDSIPLTGSAEGIEDSPAGAKLAERHQFWLGQMPTDAQALWDWLLVQDTATRLGLLAYCTGCSVNAVRKRHAQTENNRLNHADQLALALGLDMTQWWQPTAESYLRHVPKARILEAVKEGVTTEAAENLAKLKKDALTAEAEKRLGGTGWLPTILRVPARPEADVMAMAAE
ncbi:MAG TPA: ParB/RepB/Spo0J family partition protein [Stellaceae bacterium]|nr:ParB/RepB/Spo0J family partition protein [Stellaceae bacterium]